MTLLLALAETSPPSYGLGLLQAFVALAGICALLYAATRFGVSRGMGIARGERSMTVLERLPLEPRRSLYLVEVDGRRLVIGVGEGAPRLIVALDERRDDAGEVAFRDVLASAGRPPVG